MRPPGDDAPRDPRARFDDLIVRTDDVPVGEDAMTAIADSAAAQIGWVAVAIVVDPDGRVLLVYDDRDGAWYAPGGTAIPGESLRETVEREVVEETGIVPTTHRPAGVQELTFHHGDRTAGFTVVTFAAEAPPDEPSVDTSAADPELVEARWFDRPPAATVEREWHVTLLERVRDRVGRDR